VSSIFLSGVLAAWTLGHLGLGLFFMLAYMLGRRETEYLLFGLLCGAFSVLTGGVAYDLSVSTLEERLFADQITHTGGVLASAFNVHFAACFAFPRRRRRALGALYALAALLFVAIWSGALWVPGSYRVIETSAFGFEARQAIGSVTWIGAAYYLVASSEVVLAVGFLFWAVRQSRREALTSLIGAAVVVLAVLNDFALALGVLHETITLVPHVFLIYAFGASATLLWRYRAATGELEKTTHRLQQRTEELRHSYAELAQVQSELLTKKQLAAVGELAAAIAHEVRNPLAVIVNAVAGLRRACLKDTDRTMLLGIVEEEAGRLNRLVTDLLRFARPVNVKRAPVSLVELANRCRMNAAEGYEVRVECPDDPAVNTVHVDPNLFRLVFDNLVSNAFQAMRGGGAVDIRIDRAELRGEPATRIEIRDRGHGMEPQVRKRALDPFFTTRPSGTGLGLPIVQRIVEAHGGELLLESEENEGTRITIVVPARTAEEKALPGPEAERVA
jgi:signal transduction histidine kinase